MASTYDLISSSTVTSATTTVSFTSIPSTYTDLAISIHAKRDSGSPSNAFVRFNADSGNNYLRAVLHNTAGSTSVTGTRDTQSGITIWLTTNFSVYNIEVYHYASSNKHKYSNYFAGSHDQLAGFYGFNWSNSGAVTSIDFVTTSNNWDVGSTFSIFGIKGA